jgi:hypothetical protein
MERWEAVRVLFERTQLPDEAVLGAMAVLDTDGVQLTMANVVAAAFIAYKNHGTSTDDRISYFRSDIVPLLPCTDLKRDELRLLAAIGWGMPSRTRLDGALDLAHTLGAPPLNVGRPAVLALLVPECMAMTDEQHARVVLCAAALMASPASTPELERWMWGLPCDSASREFIVSWAVRIALLARSRIDTATKAHEEPARGTKRPREEGIAVGGV